MRRQKKNRNRNWNWNWNSGHDDEVETENKRLKSEVYRLQMATHQLSSKTKTGRAKKGAPGAGSAEERETASVTKFWLWKCVKFLRDETQIN